MVALALLVSAGVQAQSWTGSAVSDGLALLYNVGTGQYFSRGNGWNTQASISGIHGAIPVTLKLVSDGKYFICTNYSKDQCNNGEDYNGLENLSGGTVYTDQSRNSLATWTFTEVDAENHIYNIISADNHGGGAGAYLTAEGGESTIIFPGADGESDNAKWKIFSFAEQKAKTLELMASASDASPVDATLLIDDPDFSSPALAGYWTVEASNKNLCGGLVTNHCAESYKNGGCNIYQTITVPNGTYLVKCQGFYRESTTPSYLYVNTEEPQALKEFNANGEETAANMNGASTSFSAGHYQLDGVTVVVTGGSLTIGIQGQPGNWTCFDNFQLSYLGPLDLSSYQTGLANAVARAEATNGTIPDACYQAIQSVVTEYNVEYDNFDDYQTAIDAIDGAVATYASEEIVEAFDNFNKIYARAQALGTQTVAETALQAAYNATLPQAQTEVQEATTVEEVNTVIAEVNSGIRNYINHVEAIDLTCLLPNADVTPLWDSTWGIQPEGWYNEQDGGNFQVMSNGNMGPGGEVFMEYWNGSPAQNGFVLCQKITLPEGTYQMTGRVAANFDGQGGTVQNVFFAANDVLGTQITSETLMDASLEFVQASTCEVKIGMKATEGNQARWMGINKITLAKVPASSFVLDEDVEFTPVDKAGNVTLNKTLYQGWNSIVLPCFVNSATVSLMKMQYNAELYKFTGAEEGELKFDRATTIDPHTPYLLKIGSTDVNGSKVEIPLGDLTLSTGNPAATPYEGYNFVGTYTPLAAGNDVITSDDYVLGETDFVKAQGGNALKAFRAYIKTNTEELTPNEEGARVLKIVVDGEATTIKSIDGKNLSNDAIFNLAGQRVVKAQKGLYIQNGKKVIVK